MIEVNGVNALTLQLDAKFNIVGQYKRLRA
jgi:hypothetical protein